MLFPIVGRDPDAAWRALCDFAGRPDMETDESGKGTAAWRGRGNNGNGEPADEVARFRQGMGEMLASHSLAEWEGFFEQQPDFIWSHVRSHTETRIHILAPIHSNS